MNANGQTLEIRDRKIPGRLCARVASLWVLLTWGCIVSAEDFSALCADRAAVERVYYSHRLGTKPPFEQAMPASMVEKLVREDLHKESVLKQVYGVEITPAMLAAEVQRINTSTRAPDVLAELKAALNNDPERFACTVARPIVVERILRNKFDNDDAVHALQRQQVENIRAELLSARQNGAGPGKLMSLFLQNGSDHVNETTWQLGRPPGESPEDTRELMAAQQRPGPDAHVLSGSNHSSGPQKFYFDELPPELQQILRVQLSQPGDVSAVIETPGGFLLYLCKEKTAVTLNVETLSLSKRSYEQWLAEQGEPGP
jgi:hypothetical protein